MVGVLKPCVSEHKPEQTKHSVLVKLFALILPLDKLGFFTKLFPKN